MPCLSTERLRGIVIPAISNAASAHGGFPGSAVIDQSLVSSGVASELASSVGTRDHIAHPAVRSAGCGAGRPLEKKGGGLFMKTIALTLIVSVISSAAAADVKRNKSMPQPLWGRWGPSADACKNSDETVFKLTATNVLLQRQTAWSTWSARPQASTARNIPCC